MNTQGDVFRFVDFIRRFFVETRGENAAGGGGIPRFGIGHGPEPALHDGQASETVTVTQLRLYPIKSCAAMEVRSWPLGESGLLFDREYVVVDGSGTALSLKGESRLTLIKPVIDLSRGGSMTISLVRDESDDGGAEAVSTEIFLLHFFWFCSS